MQPDCKNGPGSPRRAFVALLLALCVLTGQSGVATHELGHALEELSASSVPAHGGEHSDAGGCDHGDGEQENCPLHALFAELGSLAVGAWPAFATHVAARESTVFTDAPRLVAPRVAFRSRAPPVLPA